VQGGGLAEGDAVVVAVERPKTASEGTTTQRPPGFNVGGGGGGRRR
jgi:hypothetical protein